jgi:hypothetical protein
MVPASNHLDPDYRRQLLRERREAAARLERQTAQWVPAPTRCAYCFERIPPGRRDGFCSDRCDDAHGRLMPVW